MSDTFGHIFMILFRFCIYTQGPLTVSMQIFIVFSKLLQLRRAAKIEMFGFHN